MSNPWDNHPNAKYIDSVLASINSNPMEWEMVTDIVKEYEMYDTWAPNKFEGNRATDIILDAVWVATMSDSTYAARAVAWYAIAALIACDDCAHMLDSEPDELRILAKFGVPAATLMIPAASAFKKIKEKDKNEKSFSK